MEFKRAIIELICESTTDVNSIEQSKNDSIKFLGPNIPLRTNDTKLDSMLSPNQFGCLAGLLLILFSNYQIDKDKFLNRLWFFLRSSSVREFAFVTTCFLVWLLFVPLILLVVGIFRIHKEIDEYKLRKDKNFKGSLNGEDIVWACEDALSKSIINVLAYVRAPSELQESFPQNLLQSIRDRIQTKLMKTNRFPKMFYRRRKSDSGYFYWTDENSLTINDYVRFSENKEKKDVINEEDFKEKMSEISNETLPADNTALWECLVGQQMVQVGNDLKYPVIFRVHHSVGDGVALLRLFLESLADKEDIDMVEDDSLLSQSGESFSEKMLRYAVNLITFIKMPSVLFSAVMKAIDDNPIHPQKLSGKKRVNWLYESDSSGNYPTMLAVVKLLKRQFDGGRFSNILLAALSKSLKDFCERKNYNVPKEMTVVIPARLQNSRENPQLRLENKFSVALQTLPIDINVRSDRISKVRRCSEIAVASPDYLINFWMMTLVSAIFPDWILKVIMVSKHATMAVSNLPGPSCSIKINGYEFESVGFFIPSVGQTAVGVSILSYNNKLHFGITADEAAIENENDLGEILTGMKQEIEAMTMSVMM